MIVSYKQIIIVRTDLKMGEGKIATQAAHASVGACKVAESRNKSAVQRWGREGGKKVVLKVGGLRQLKNLYDRAKKMRLPCFLVRDAGLTQLKKGTVTCLGIGPVEEAKVDSLTKDLKLL